MSAVEWTQIAATVVTLLLAIAAFLTLHETRKLGAATVKQADAARRQAEIAMGELEATREQVELATHSFASQIMAVLLPAGEEEFEIGEREDIGGSIQQLHVLPLYFGIVNVGNGVAVLDDIEAEGQGLGRAEVLVPPSIASGQTRRIRADFGWLESVNAGDRLQVAVTYHGVDGSAARLTFSAQYLTHRRWRIEHAENETIVKSALTPR